VGRKELLRDVGGEKVGRRVSTEQESNADNSDQYRPGTTLRRTCRRMCWTGWAGRCTGEGDGEADNADA